MTEQLPNWRLNGWHVENGIPKGSSQDGKNKDGKNKKGKNKTGQDHVNATVDSQAPTEHCNNVGRERRPLPDDPQRKTRAKASWDAITASVSTACKSGVL